MVGFISWPVALPRVMPVALPRVLPVALPRVMLDMYYFALQMHILI